LSSICRPWPRAVAIPTRRCRICRQPSTIHAPRTRPALTRGHSIHGSWVSI
jgi:hypothetical protein